MSTTDQLTTLDKCNKSFIETLKQKSHDPVYAKTVDILQLNVGKKCNLKCKHCHVEASPDSEQSMSPEVLKICLAVLRDNPEISTIDITGGAPELNPNLEWFIRDAAALNKRLIVRSNLVVLLEEKYKKFIDIYTDFKVEIMTSLPDYEQSRADRQRGPGFFEKFIRAMIILNEKGYGKTNSGLMLNLIHNPLGAYLPASQKMIDQDYRLRLKSNHNVDFNLLMCLNNMPVGRYLDYLIMSGNYEEYMELLISAFNTSSVENIMCRSTISVGWDGALFDCDFNQMLGMPINEKYSNNINNFDVNKLKQRTIEVDNHCFGCTAGAGSSCQGALD